MFLKHLLKTNREYKNLKKQKIKDIYRNELGKTCFQYDIPWENFEDLPGRTISHKVLLGKAFNIAKNPEYDGHQRGLASVDTRANKFATHTGKRS